MAIDYTSLAQTASLLLGENGKASVYLKQTEVLYSDPVSGEVIMDLPSEAATNAVLIQHDEKYTPGAMVEEGDKFLVIDQPARLEDQLVIDDVEYRIVNVWPIEPGDTYVATRVQIRA